MSGLEYDKKYLYAEWDDALEGKEVLVGSTVADIREQVLHKGPFKIVESSGDMRYPFWNSDEQVSFNFVYYDPALPVKWAFYLDSIAIELRFNSDFDWVKFEPGSEPNWENVTDFRVAGPRTAYRPFGSIYELFDRIFPKETGALLTRPALWVKGKSTGVEYQVLAVDPDRNLVTLQQSSYRLDSLFEGFVFLDGTPCGVEVVMGDD